MRRRKRDNEREREKDEEGRECQMQLCFVGTLRQRECVGAAVTSAEGRCALCRGEVYMQINTALSRVNFMAQLTRAKTSPLLTSLDISFGSKYPSSIWPMFELVFRRQCPSTLLTSISAYRFLQPGCELLDFSISSSSPVSNASLVIADSYFRRIFQAIAQSTLPRYTACKLLPNPSCASFVCCYCCFRCCCF